MLQNPLNLVRREGLTTAAPTLDVETQLEQSSGHLVESHDLKNHLLIAMADRCIARNLATTGTELSCAKTDRLTNLAYVKFALMNGGSIIT